jgi:membrane-associated phospholipid phosphatase
MLDAISMSSCGLYAVPIILYLISGNVWELLGLIGLLGSLGISEFIKHYIVKKDSPRPKGASNCNLWCNDGLREGQPGMPSSHSAQVAFFSAFYYQKVSNPILKGALIVYALAVMYSRYAKHCHSIPQIIIGALIGLGMVRTLSCLKNQ